MFKLTICPVCKSKRLVKLTKPSEYFCPKCSRKFSINIQELPIDRCFKCNRSIVDTANAVYMGNGKLKHSRCRRKSLSAAQ